MKFTELPAAGYDGPIPDFPLPEPSDRELQVWSQAWRSPQAAAWSAPSEQWRTETAAMWVRIKVRCEDPAASPSLLAQLHRFADQIGFTPAGMKDAGWKIVAEKPHVDVPASAPVRRLRAPAEPS